MRVQTRGSSLIMRALGAWTAWSLVFPALVSSAPMADGVVDIGSRRELWVDGFLVERLSGAAELRLHYPTAQEVVIVHDAPWEGSASAYHSLFQDGDLYRMYYRGWNIAYANGKISFTNNYLCQAESSDGVHWRKPDLGIHEFKGSKANNIVLTSGRYEGMNVDAGHPAVFKDDNPAADADARYKAVILSKKPLGLLAFKSPDGLRWSPIRTAPVISDGAFDSQNVAFWDEVRSEYRAYWRYFSGGGTSDTEWKPQGYRAIRTAASKDFIHWSEARDLTYVDSPDEHLYTNAIKPYHRAPHVLIGFPSRYIERGWSDAMRALPDAEHREMRAAVVERYGTALTETLIMASRDGVRFKRWHDAFVRPGPERPGTWKYSHLLTGWHLLETRSALPGAPNELSLYAVEGYGTAKASSLRRYTLRLDGFVSVQAPMSGGEVISRPVRFAGAGLFLNFATSAAGSVQVELQDDSGRPLPGFSLEDCPPIFGDTVDRGVSWKNGSDVSAMSGKPVRLRFVLKDADVYSFQFKD